MNIIECFNILIQDKRFRKLTEDIIRDLFCDLPKAEPWSPNIKG